MSLWSLEVLSDVLGGRHNLSQVGRITPGAVIELDERLVERASAVSFVATPGEYRAMLPARTPVDPVELQTALTYAHSTVIVDPIDQVFVGDEMGLGFTAGMISAALADGASVDEARERAERRRREAFARAVMSEEHLGWVRAELSSAVRLLAEWRPVVDAGLLHTVPARAGMAATVVDPYLRPLLTSDLITPDVLALALNDLPSELGYEEFRGGFIGFNYQLLLARAAEASPVPGDEVDWRYLRYLVNSGTITSGGAAGQAHRMLDLVPLPAMGNLRANDVLKLRRDVDEFAEWQVRLRSIGRRLPSELTDPSSFERDAREIFEEELGPTLRRLRRNTWTSAVRGALPTEALSLTFGVAGLGMTAAVGLELAPTAALAVPLASAIRLAVAALRGPASDESAVIARLVRAETRASR